jgi:hypothetical protein
MRLLALRLFDIFSDKNEKKFASGTIKVGRRAKVSFESALPLILEHVRLSIFHTVCKGSD